MANHKSAEKRIRSTKIKTQVNKHVMSALRTCQKMLEKNLKDKNVKSVEKGLSLLFKMADRAEKRGVIKKRTSSRNKSRFATKVHNLLSK